MLFLTAICKLFIVSTWENHGSKTNENYTCRFVSGSIFWTSPFVLQVSATGMLWFGLIAGILIGWAGTSPKLKIGINNASQTRSINKDVTSFDWIVWQIAKVAARPYWWRSYRHRSVLNGEPRLLQSVGPSLLRHQARSIYG